MGGGGSRGQSSVIQSTQPVIPQQVQQLLDYTTGQQIQTLSDLPLANLATAPPEQIAQLTPDQQLAIKAQTGQMFQPGGSTQQPLNALQQLAAGVSAGQAVAPDQLSGASQLQESVLQDQFMKQTLPTLQNQAAQAGLGRSGALLDSIATAQQGIPQAMVPLLAQDASLQAQTQNQGVQNLEALGGTAFTQPTTAAQNAFNAQEQQRQIQQQQFDAAQTQLQNQQAMIQNITQGALGIIPSTFGEQGFSRQRGFTSTGGIVGSLTGNPSSK